MLRLVIGLVIPFVAIVVALPWINNVSWAPLNVPFSFWWMFAWFILATVCLMVCWYGFDRHRADDLDEEEQR